MCATTDRQIRERLDRIPRPANKSKPSIAVAAKEPDPATTTAKDTNKSSGSSSGGNTDEGRPALTCYNCQKLGHVARKCLEPLTEKRKQHLANLVRQLQAAEEVESSGKESV